MRFTTTLIIALGASLALAACGKKDAAQGEGSCDSLGAHFTKLARQEVDKLPDGHAEKKAATAEIALLPKAAASLVKRCRDDKWSPEVRACFLGAKSADEFKSTCASMIKGGAGDKAPAPKASDEGKTPSKPGDEAPPADNTKPKPAKADAREADGKAPK